jgi:hypothetical protein
VLAHVLENDYRFEETGTAVRELGDRIVSANAYLGIAPICDALRTQAEVVVTGRAADPALFVAPLVHEFGWTMDDWTSLGQGTVVGHLLECAGQITGGYFADPGIKDVPRLADCGYPIAEVSPDGTAVVTKLPDAGGVVSARTVKEQMLYEVHDPTRYLTPDVTADFSRVDIREAGRDRVSVSNGGGSRRPDQLKVTVGFDGGYLGEAGVSYAGPNATRRASLAADILRERLGRHDAIARNMRIDLVGINSLHATARAAAEESGDVRVRVAMRSTDRRACETMLWEVEAMLCCGPAGGGGYRGQITPSVVTHSALIDRERVRPSVRVLVA